MVGRLGTIRSPLALIGGNCSLMGYDKEGNDVFWTVSTLHINSSFKKDVLNVCVIIMFK